MAPTPVHPKAHLLCFCPMGSPLFLEGDLAEGGTGLSSAVQGLRSGSQAVTLGSELRPPPLQTVDTSVSVDNAHVKCLTHGRCSRRRVVA